MESTEQHQVVQLRLAALGPVHDVMGVDEPRAGAPGEASAPVSSPERAADGRRDAASRAADVQDAASLVGLQGQQLRVARQAKRRVQIQGRTVIDAALPRPQVKHHLRALPAAPPAEAVRDRGLCDRDERVGEVRVGGGGS